MVSKTRERLIEVARQLFVRKGVENTTMLDIANASEKGRRTIYTYFKNKREIHQAVIERESEQIVSRQRQIRNEKMTARDKLEKFMLARYEILRCPTSQKGRDMLQLLQLLDGNRSGKTRKLAVQKEIEILHEIIEEGVENGEFSTRQAAHLASMLIIVMHGIDNDFHTDHLEQLGYVRDEAFRHAVDFILDGVTGVRQPSGDDYMDVQ